jgi:hypothetical protein
VDRLLDLLHSSRLDQPEAAFRVLGKRLAVEIREAALPSFLNLAIQPLLLPRLALARQSLGQEDLEQRLVRNVTPIRQYFEILNHGDREAQ